jgi:fucose permease
MAGFTQITDTTPYPFLLGALFVMGLGMGATMMPIMAAALATLTAHNTARGSTLLNITQQVAASIGTALFSVLLTNNVKDTDFGAFVGLRSQLDQLQGPALQEAQAQLAVLAEKVPDQLADSFASVFVVATVLVALVLVPASMLPRHKSDKPVDPTVLSGH